MINLQRCMTPLVIGVVLSVNATEAVAQHVDILVQDVDGKLTTGAADLDSGGHSLGTRVFTSQFPGSLAEDDPGWNAIASGSASLPPGSSALPGSTDLDWDFLSMTSEDISTNLLYWDAAGSTQDDVSFGAPLGVDDSLSFFGKDGKSAVADGSDQFVPGHTIDTTASNGFLHKHRFFFLDDGDGNTETTPASGIYLIAMQLRAAGLEESDPLYVLWATPGVPLSTLNGLARPWVESRVDQLVCSSFEADFDCDKDVDDDDLQAWQTGFGTLLGALKSDGDYDNDGDVDGGDFLGWQAEFGSGSGAASGAVPEPKSVLLLLGAVAAGMFPRLRRRRRAAGRV